MNPIDKFELVSEYQPAGDQPQAIKALCEGLEDGLMYQTLLGVTGSGKTFTVANIINQLNRPCIVVSHNKTLAAQLYQEFKSLFPNNAVEFFVSYYDYYQPESYVPTSDLYIEKDSSINEHIEQMRLSATKSLLERNDVIIVATVSSIYGLGEPEIYMQMLLHLQVGEKVKQRDIIQRLRDLQYTRNEFELKRATYRIKGDIIDVYPAESEKNAVRIELFDDEVESIKYFDPLTGRTLQKLYRITINPTSHYTTPQQIIDKAIIKIEVELKQRLDELNKQNRLVEMQRLEQRTKYDLEMLKELGYCNGIENYSRHLSNRKAGEASSNLYSYLAKEAFMVVDESHVTLPQFRAMYKGDRSRKENLVNYGFRLPSALDNRPMNFDEWLAIAPQTIFVSATPSDYEKEQSGQENIHEQMIRPTGILDPIIEVKPAKNQVDDLIHQIHNTIQKGGRILVTVLTKRLAEDLTQYLTDINVKVRYIHSDVDTVERVDIIHKLRIGIFDVIVGINLLREGLDMPEVSLVAVLDADKEGFLRSNSSLIQTTGRAARNINGKAIFYADKITKSMQLTIDETKRRRLIQDEYNKTHNIEPTQIIKKLDEIIEGSTEYMDKKTHKKSKINLNSKYLEVISDEDISTNLPSYIKKLEKQMFLAASDLAFEEATVLRSELERAKKLLLQS